jgi:hypothetical protein
MSNDQTRQHLVGTWKLITAVREEIASAPAIDTIRGFLIS